MGARGRPKRKKSKIDKVAMKRRKLTAKAQVNPFSRYVTPQKSRVLGKKQRINIIDLAQSRTRAIEKRKQSLLKEFEHKLKAKTNIFRDNRYGENFRGKGGRTLTKEEKNLFRFQKERVRGFKRRRFSLNEPGEDMTLTHYGKSLDQTLGDDKGWEPSLDDERGEERFDGQAFADLLLTVKPGESWHEFRKRTNLPDENDARSGKEILRDQILFTRFQRHRAQVQAKDMRLNLEDLNERFTAIKGLLGPLTGAKNTDFEDDQDYINMANEFHNSVRKRATNRTPTAAEIVYTEKKRLEELEANRNDRMFGKVVVEKQSEDPVETPTIIKDGVVLVPQKKAKKKETSKRRLPARLRIKEKKGQRVDLTNIGYVLPVPQDVEEYMELLQGQKTEDQLEIIQRIRKCNSVHLNHLENLSKMQRFYTILNQHFRILCEEMMVIKSREQRKELWENIDVSSRAMFALSQDLPKLAIGTARTRLLSMMESELSSENVKRGMPLFDVLGYMKLLTNIFPTSDYMHVVITPLLLLIEKCLMETTISGGRDVSAGLFLCGLSLHSFRVSKRYMPGVMVFLNGLLQLGGLSNEELKARGSLLLLDAEGYRSTFRAGSNIWRDLQFFSLTEIKSSGQSSSMKTSGTDEVSLIKTSVADESSSMETSDAETKTSEADRDSSIKTSEGNKASSIEKLGTTDEASSMNTSEVDEASSMKSLEGDENSSITNSNPNNVPSPKTSEADEASSIKTADVGEASSMDNFLIDESSNEDSDEESTDHLDGDEVLRVPHGNIPNGLGKPKPDSSSEWSSSEEEEEKPEKKDREVKNIKDKAITQAGKDEDEETSSESEDQDNSKVGKDEGKETEADKEEKTKEDQDKETAAEAEARERNLIGVKELCLPNWDPHFATTEFALKSLRTAITLVAKAAELWVDLEAFREAFQPFLNRISQLKQAKDAPANIQDLCAVAEMKIKKGFERWKERKTLSMNLRPKVVPSLEPDFSMDFNPEHMDPDKQRRAKRVAKIRAKNDKRSRMRELRKDTAFLQREKLRLEDERREDRAIKQKQIWNDLYNQARDSNIFDKIKAKGKKLKG